MCVSYPAGLLNVGGSTQVPACDWNNVQRGTWGLPPPVNLESCRITFTLLVRHKTQSISQSIILTFHRFKNLLQWFNTLKCFKEIFLYCFQAHIQHSLAGSTFKTVLFTVLIKDKIWYPFQNEHVKVYWSKKFTVEKIHFSKIN